MGDDDMASYLIVTPKGDDQVGRFVVVAHIVEVPDNFERRGRVRFGGENRVAR